MSDGATATPRPAVAASGGRSWTAAVMHTPAALLLALAIVLVLSHGGYAAGTWYPAALFTLALCAVAAIAAGSPSDTRWEAFRWPLILLALLTAWGFASISWAVVPGLAWDGANRNLLYVLVLATATLRPWTVVSARAALLVAVAALTALGVGVLIVAATRSHPETMFIDLRLSLPTGYANATANLWLLAVPPALWLACDPALRWYLRGSCLAAAGFLIGISVLSQSRGGVIALAGGLLVLVALAPRRWPALLATLAVVGANAAIASVLLDVRDGGRAGLVASLHDARLALAIMSAVLLAVGCLAALADAPIARRLPGSARRHGDRALAVLVLVAVVGALAATGGPAGWVHDRWQDFKSNGYSAVDTSTNRFSGSLGSNRYDFYRVGLNVFRDHPIGGIGLDGFGVSYLRHGRSGEQPHYAHSLPISVLAETGLVGAVLFVAFLVAAIAGGGHLMRRHRDRAAAGVAAGAMASFAVFLFGCAVDWLWQFPALGIIAFLALGVALRATVSGETVVDLGRAPRERNATSRAIAVLAGAGVLAAALSFALPSIATRFTDAAYGQSATDPALAVDRLDRAADYDPLSADPLLAKGIILRRLGRTSEARGALGEAIDREPQNWFAYFERAMLESTESAWSAARADAAVARRLNPRQSLVAVVQRAVQRRQRVVAERIEAQLAAQLQAKLHPGG